MASLRNEIVSAFKLNGLILRGESTKYLYEVLSTIETEHRSQCLERLIESIQKQPLSSSTIEVDACKLAVTECNQENSEHIDNVFNIIDAYSVPQFVFDLDSKVFHKSSALKSIISEANDKIALFRNRYFQLLQRANRHELFTKSSIPSNINNQKEKFKLKPVDFLLGNSQVIGNIIILGMLTQLKEGKWYLEDPTGSVQLDLSKANFHTGLYTENCFVLVEGTYEDGVLQVIALGFPPAETSEATRTYFGDVNFFGGPVTTNVKMSVKLKEYEVANEDALFVILSDVWFDDSKVISKLRTLFTGYSHSAPTCFIFCGNFSNQPFTLMQVKTMKDSLKNLADLILEFSSLAENSQFVFVPGPQDPGLGEILPRPPIPTTVHSEFTRRIKMCHFTTNPCRIQYSTQEIVIFREDIVSKMCRNCLKYPTDSIPNHFAKTIICQGHLCPLPLHAQPIYWQHDQAMRVYPLPDLIICADKFDAYSASHSECNVINPGSFSRNGYSFKAYWPSTKQVEDCQITD